MKKITLLFLTVCSIFLFAQTTRTTDVVSPTIIPKPTSFKTPTGAFMTTADYITEFNNQNLIAPKLYGQGPLGQDIISSEFEAANSQYSNNAADDFIVPTNKIWTINSVSANGTTVNALYPTSFNVIIYKNSTTGNLPGVTVRNENIVLAVGSSSPTLPLATPLILTEGKYWISVQSVGDYNTQKWYWSTYNDPSTLNSPFAWINPGNGFGTSCTTAWNTASICSPGQLKDLQFRLDGLESNPCKVIVGRINTTDPTQTLRILRDGVASACGTPKVFPGTLGTGGFHYKTYSFQNTSATTACVTITLNNADPINNVHLVAYNNTFNPADISQNYMGDIGSSSSSSNIQVMNINVPGNSTVVLIASEVTANTVYTGDYTINVTSPDCATILKTVDNPKSAVSVYPNPTSSILFVNGMQPKSASIFDISGKLIPVKVNGNTVDTQKLPKGNYILKMEDKEGNSSTTKFIKK